jgi:hypothetical protein
VSNFKRPENTIENAYDLNVGDHVWHVFGIWPPQMGGEHIITRPAGLFKHHPEYSEIHLLSADQAVFDTRYLDSENSIMNFASDGNLTPGRSCNDNYWFRAEVEAEAAVDFLRKEWEARPALIVETLRTRRQRLYEYEDWAMTRDDAIAHGFRLAWRWVPVATAVVVGSFIAIAALGGYFWEQIEAASAFRRIMG